MDDGPCRAAVSPDERPTVIVATTADTMRALGLGVALPAVCAMAGILVFAAVVHRGPAAEVHALVRLAHRLAVLAAGGAVIEVAAVARVFGDGWLDTLTDRTPGAMLRLLGAALVAAGLFELADTRASTDTGDVRWSPAGAGVLAIAGAVVALVSFAFDGHTVTRGPRAVHGVASAVHAAAASVWAGGAVALLAVWLIRRRSGAGSLSTEVRGYVRVALVALVAVGVSGALLTVFVADSAGDVTGSAWGHVLLVKLAAVVVAVVAGGLLVGDDRGRTGGALALQSAALLGVLVLTSLLVRTGV